MDGTRKRPNPLVEFFVVPFRPRSYGNLLYLWLAFPLGLLYFVGLVCGFATGIPLTIVWVGLLILLATLMLAWVAEGFERRMAMLLLGADVPTRRPRPLPAKPLAQIGSTLASPALWKGMLFLALKFPIGLAGWVGSLVGLTVSLAFLAAPGLVAFGLGDVDFGLWQPDSVLEALPLGFAGLLGLLLTFHLQNALGWLWARLAELLLGAELPAPASPATATPAAA